MLPQFHCWQWGDTKFKYLHICLDGLIQHKIAALIVLCKNPFRKDDIENPLIAINTKEIYDLDISVINGKKHFACFDAFDKQIMNTTMWKMSRIIYDLYCELGNGLIVFIAFLSVMFLWLLNVYQNMQIKILSPPA